MTRAELRWVLVASTAVLLLVSLPTVYAWMNEDPEHVFTGFVYIAEDGHSYLAKMQQGARGEWLFHLPFSTEPHPGAFLYVFHLLLGKVAAVLGMSLPCTYHLARVLCGFILLVTVYAFVAHFVRTIATRRLAWFLVAMGSGLGWLLLLLGGSNWLGNLPLEFWAYEAYLLIPLLSLPHVALAEAALLWSMLCLLGASGPGSLRRAVLGSLSALCMTLIVPLYLVVLAAVMVGYLGLIGILERRIPWGELGCSVLIGVPASAVPIYMLWLTRTDAVYRQWAAQLVQPSPHPLHYAIGYATLLLPGLWWGYAQFRRRDEIDLHSTWWRTMLLPVAWLLVAPVLAYLPFNAQRRLVVLVQVPLAMAAAAGLHAIFGRGTGAIKAYAAVVSLSTWLLIFGSAVPIRERVPNIYRSAAEIAAVDWLGAHAQPRDSVLSSYRVGNIIPTRQDLLVFIGHGPETIDSSQKAQMVEQFFQEGTAHEWRQALLKEHGLDYLFYGPEEQALGNWEPSGSAYLSEIYRSEGYAIYEVAGED